MFPEIGATTFPSNSCLVSSPLLPFLNKSNNPILIPPIYLFLFQISHFYVTTYNQISQILI